MGFKWGAPLYPPSLHDFFESPVPEGTYKGKKILTIHGEIDELVPYRVGGQEIERIQKEVKASPGGDMEIWIVEETGHVLTPKMVQRTADWVYQHSMVLLHSDPGPDVRSCKISSSHWRLITW